MANKFLTNIELDAGLVDGSNSTGTSGYLLSSTGTATSWVDPAALAVGESEQVHIACKNTSGVAISKGDPVYITGTVGASYIIQIARADASNSAKMPAVGLAETDLGLNAEGFVIVSGVLKNLTTDPLSTGDGTPSSNDTVYVKAGGGLTRTKPTGSGNLIQNVGKVGRVQGTSAGSIAVSTIMRTNDVPNLTTGKIWVGSPTYTTESTVVHLDESNGRMGIGTTSPGAKLDVNGVSRISGTFAETGQDPLLEFYNTDTSLGANQILGTIDFYQSDPSGGGAGVVSRIRSINDSGFKGEASLTFHTGEANVSFQERMRINSAGNVGIGRSSSITARLFVEGPTDTATISTSSTPAARINNGGAISNWIGSNGYNYGYIQSIQDDGSNNLKPLALQPLGGNVGIGTTSPGDALVVKGGSPGNIDLVSFQNNAGNETHRFYTDSANDGVIETVTNAGVTANLIQSSGDSYFNGGNVGIGTASPDSKLDVTGGDITINTSGTAFMNFKYGSVGSEVSRGTITTDGIDLKINATSDLLLLPSGNVGIGTTSPGYRLTVASDLGTGGTLAEFQNSNLTYSQNLYLSFNSSKDVTWSQASSVGGSIFSTGTRGFSFQINTVDKVKIDSAGQFKLLDYGSGTFTGTATQRLAVDSSGNVIEIPIGSGPVDGNGTENYVAKWSDADTITDSLIYDDGTFVGIGTTNPGEKFQVGDSGDTSNYVRVRTATSDVYVGANPSSTHIGINNGGKILQTLAYPLAIGTVQNQELYLGANNAIIATLVDGKFGIGTTSPGYKLDVNGITRSKQGFMSHVGIYTSGGTYTNQWQEFARASYSTFSFSGFKLSVQIIGDTGNVNTNAEVHINWKFQSNNGRIYANIINYGETPLTANDFEIYRDGTNNQLVFYHRIIKNYSQPTYTVIGESGLVFSSSVIGASLSGVTNDAFTEKTIRDSMTIESNTGYVGIGTTDPSEELHISSENPGIRLQDSDGTDTFGRVHFTNTNLQFYSRNDTSNGIFSWYGSNGTTDTEHMRIDADGYVGIGTPSPQYKLDVDGDVQINETLIAKAGADLILQARSSQVVGINSNGTRTMTLDASNNVGIGATSPSAKLHVENSDTTKTAIHISNTSTGGKKWDIASIGSGVTGRVGNLQIRNETDSANYVEITHGGNVGIGTTSPGAKLEVAGTLKATGEVTLSNYSDGGLSVNSSGVVRVEPSYQNISLGESYAANLREYYYRNGYTVSPADTGYQYAKLIDQGILNKASLVIMPQAQKEGLLAANKPNGTDFTFTRASSATRVNSEGLIEKERGNLLLQSNSFDTTWTQQNTTLTDGQSGYDGSSDAWKVEATTTATTRLYQSSSISANTLITMSVYAKVGNVDFIKFNLATSGTNSIVTFDLTDGTTYSSNAIDTTWESVGGGWVRISATFLNSDSITEPRIEVRSAYNNASCDAGSYVYIQDAQLEVGLVATDYIETTTTAVYEGITDNIPRLDYTDASCPSLLVERQRTNLVYQSEYLGAWSASNCSVTANSITSPEGVTNSFKITENSAASTQHRVSLGSIGGSSAIYTMSAYVKNSSGTRMAYIDMGLVTAYFNFSTETIYSTTGTADYKDVGNGWYRIWVRSNSATSVTTCFAGLSVNNNETYTGDGLSAIEFYGIQLEEGNYPTSYIPTYGASVTRVNDSCTNFTFNDLRTTDASIFVEFNYTTGKTGNFRYVFSTENSTTGNFDAIQLNSTVGGTSFSFGINGSGISLSTLSLLSGTNKALIKFERSSGAVKTFLNGTEIDSATASSIPEIHKISLGARINPYSVFATDREYGDTIKQFLAFPMALTDSECIALTTL